MLKKLLIVTFLVFLGSSMNAQTQKYWVSLTDKQGVIFEPENYFSPKALERKKRMNIPVDQSSDWPLQKIYVDEISFLSDSVGIQSRWLNGLVVYANDEQLNNIRLLPFVRDLHNLSDQKLLISANKDTLDLGLSYDENLILQEQLNRMNGDEFIQNEVTGKGIRIAVFDIGFENTDTHEALEHLRAGNKIIKTWDFVDNDENVYHYHSHGTQVLSCITGKMDTLQLGFATESEFLLARTEKNSEKIKEEENWLAAAEWADKNGVDIINSSLGYTHHRYFNDQMDGKFSLIAKAASMAAQKGMLVVNAAGNSGSDDWYYIGTPADVDSVLTVGGISPETNYHINFSSYGPTSDGRLKPNVCAFGKVVAARGSKLSIVHGTSFASPLVAGFAACAWQLNPEWSNMDLFSALEKSSELYPYFDYAHGYGVPQAGYFTKAGDLEISDSFSFQQKGDSLIVISNQIEADKLFSDNNLLFYNFQGSDGVLKEYAVINVYQDEALSFDLKSINPGTRINVWFRGRHKSFLVRE